MNADEVAKSKLERADDCLIMTSLAGSVREPTEALREPTEAVALPVFPANWAAQLSPLGTPGEIAGAFDFASVAPIGSEQLPLDPPVLEAEELLGRRHKRRRRAARPYSPPDGAAAEGNDEDNHTSPSTCSSSKPFRRPWAQHEDAAVRDAVEAHGLRAWSFVSSQVPG